MCWSTLRLQETIASVMQAGSYVWLGLQETIATVMQAGSYVCLGLQETISTVMQAGSYICMFRTARIKLNLQQFHFQAHNFTHQNKKKLSGTESQKKNMTEDKIFLKYSTGENRYF